MTNAEIKKIFSFLSDEHTNFRIQYLKKCKERGLSKFKTIQKNMRREFEYFSVDYDDSEYFGHQPDILTRKLQENPKLGEKIGLALNPEDVPYFVYGVLFNRGEYSEAEQPNEGVGGFNFDDDYVIEGKFFPYWKLYRRRLLSIVYDDEILEKNKETIDTSFLKDVSSLIDEAKEGARELKELLGLCKVTCM